MHNTHHTLVPIGANFQTLIPPVLTQNAYRVKSAEMMNSLQKLKINDPEEGGEFFDKYSELIRRRFGEERSYEDVNHLRNAFRRMNSKLTFEEYLAKNAKYWEAHFKNKDRAILPKIAVKKKKKRGTIPI